MRIIDEKGKLFGIINIIDLTVLLIIVLLVGGGIKRAKTKPELITETKKALITVEVSEIRKPTVDALVVGDSFYHYDKGVLLGKIVDKKVEPYKEAVESGDGKWVLAEVPEKYVVKLTIEADAKVTPDLVSVEGEHIRVGTQFRLKNKKVAIFGTILDVEVE